MKKIIFVNESLSKFLDDTKGLQNLVNIGVTVFQKNKSKIGGSAECIYRIVQDGIKSLVPYMTKRSFVTSNLETFKKLIMRKYNKIEDLSDLDLGDLSGGCFVVRYKDEALAMHNCNN